MFHFLFAPQAWTWSAEDGNLEQSRARVSNIDENRDNFNFLLHDFRQDIPLPSLDHGPQLQKRRPAAPSYMHCNTAGVDQQQENNYTHNSADYNQQHENNYTHSLPDTYLVGGSSSSSSSSSTFSRMPKRSRVSACSSGDLVSGGPINGMSDGSHSPRLISAQAAGENTVNGSESWDIPFIGDFSGCAWNAQALFHSKARRQQPKLRKARRLATAHGFTILSETHCLKGRAMALRLPEGMLGLWNDGSSSAGGVGIILSRQFLAQFRPVDETKDWITIVPGHVAVLRLRGAQGSLDIFCVYMPTGTAGSASDREDCIRSIAEHMNPRDRVLTILSGDFNFVESEGDRASAATGQVSSQVDARETKAWLEAIADPHGVYEWAQPQYTHKNAGFYSRIDRMYCNQHVSYQLDRHSSCCMLEGDWELSHHRPISFYRRTPPPKSRDKRPITAREISKEGWAAGVKCTFDRLCTQDTAVANPFRRLVLLKDAMIQTTSCFRNIDTLHGMQEHKTDDEIGYSMACLRALERKDTKAVSRFCRVCPKLLDFIPYQDTTMLLTCRMQALREHIIELHRKQIGEDVQELSGEGCSDPEERTRAKENILRKLKRLMPGESTGIGAMQDSTGTVRTTPEDIARILKQHWQGVFTEKQIDDHALQLWMEELFIYDENAGCFITGLPNQGDTQWVIRRKDVKAAVKAARDTMPGPDGIPAQAYKLLGDVAITILFDAAVALGMDSHEQSLVEAFADRSSEGSHLFNASLLCCLPKKPHKTDPEHGEVYRGEDTRPLALVNVDNRIIASAARIRWEPLLARHYISSMQQGFLRGRMMTNNILDIDYDAMTVSLKCKKGALLFFDFKAAFPSVSHRFLINALRNIGLPDHAISFVTALYHNNNCTLCFQGEQYEGFGMFCGVRQGCPISPLLFAAAVDVLLRMLAKRLPTGTFRAFADDIGTVVEDWPGSAAILQQVFSEFEDMSGLALNIEKTVCIPLWEGASEEVQNSVKDTKWDGLCIATHAAYLGVEQGPGKGTHTWKKPVAKYLDRCQKWANLGHGLLYSTMAYNSFASSVLSFVGQFEDPPLEALKAEKEGLRRMTPGPGKWCMPEDLFFLKESYGQSMSFQSLQFTAQAAKLRISAHHLLHNRQHGTLRDSIAQRSRHIKELLRNTQFTVRPAMWKGWYQNSYTLSIARNEDRLRADGVILEQLLSDIAGSLVWDEDACRKQRERIQRVALRAIKQVHLPDPQNRLRNKLARWYKNKNYHPSAVPYHDLVGPPAHVAARVHKHLLRLPHIVAPRVAAAVFKCVFNGWCTKARFQQRYSNSSVCLLGCGGQALDAIEHYCCCPQVHEVLWKKLRATMPIKHCLNIWLLNDPRQDLDEYLMCSSLITYVTYMAFNLFRHTGVPSQEIAKQAMGQFLHTAVAGHARTSAFIDERWVGHSCLAF